MHITAQARAEATYRIEFDDIACQPRSVIAQVIVDVIETLQPIEVVVSASSGKLVAYVVVPSDVMPELLDRKADALRAKWETIVFRGA